MTAKIKLNAASGGGSVSLQAPSSSSNNRVISLPDIADGTLLTSQSSLDSTKLSPAISTGKILQVKQTFKNDTASTSSGTYAAISGLTVAITPSSSSNKILYMGSLYLAGTSAEAVFRLTRTIGGTLSNISGGNTFVDDEDGSFLIGGSSLYRSASFQFLDSPNTTSEITYGINWQVHSGTMYLNRTWDAGFGHGASAITVMEVAA
jgi:hypothetical protein